ncbi:hypothetical protein ACOMHN_019762 [Nucella lapillus]
MDPHECAVCKGPYRAPKFLPCFHTFCAMCVQGVADSSSEDGFPCPDCQVTTSLPPGGVDFLPNNAYIILNKDHCKLREHANHETETLTTRVSLKKTEVQKVLTHVSAVIYGRTDNVASLQEQKRAIEKQYEDMAQNVQNRHTITVTTADDIIEDELEYLQSWHTGEANDINRKIEEQEGYKADLSDLLQNANDTVASGTDGDVLTVAKEMTSGRGSQRATDVMLPQQDRLLYRPVLHVDVRTYQALRTIGRYVGTVHQTQEKKTVPEMKVTGGFQCEEGPNVEVFSLCHSNGKLIVSYEWCGMKKNAHVRGFRETGEFEMNWLATGKITCRGLHQNLFSFSKIPDCMFNKSPTVAHFSLVSMATGEALIIRYTIISSEPYIHETILEFKIQVLLPRVFDVDDTEQYFAVVADVDDSKLTLRRRVHLFRRSEKKAVSTYTPPTEDCLPSDVCFYTLRGQMVLLITDERTNSIHVATIQGDSLYFVRYLCVNCPSLIQPTAITVDVHRRLWVACRGGRILMLEQIE